MADHKAILIAGLACAAACTGTRIGNPVKDGTITGGATGSSFGCVRVPSTLDAFDTKSPLGFSADDVLAWAEGEHTAALQWEVPIDSGADAGAPTLHVTIQRGSTQARFVDSKPSDGSGAGSSSMDGGSVGIGARVAFECSTQAAVEIDVDVAVKSDDGALDEHLEGTLHASRRLYATLQLGVDAAKVGGHLQPMVSCGGQAQRIAIDLTLAPLGMIGQVSAQSGGAQGVGCAMRQGAVGAACGGQGFAISADTPIENVTLQNVLDLVSGLDTTLTWRDGSSTSVTLKLALESSPVCILFDLPQRPADDSAFQFRAELRISSDDGRLHATWPADVQASIKNDGSLGKIIVGATLLARAPADFESTYGFSGLDPGAIDPIDGAFVLQWDPDAESWSGTLGVSGEGQTCPDHALADGSTQCWGATVDIEDAKLTSRAGDAGAAP